MEFDEGKRALVLAQRGLDLAAAGRVFDGFHLTRRDAKHSDTEERFHTIGILDQEVVIVTWTPRESARRAITMWKASEQERTRYAQERDQVG